MRELVPWFFVLNLFLTILSAQSQQPPSPPAPPPAQPPSRRPVQPTPRGPAQQQSRIIFLSGSVQYADGTPVSDPLLVELRCNGNTRSQVWSSVDGRFSFQLGGNREFSAFDVSVGGGGFGGGADPTRGSTGFGLDPFGDTDRTRPLNLSSCEIRLAQAGYRAQPIRLGLRSALDNPDVGVLIIEQRPGVDGTLVSVKTLAAPKKARRAFEKAGKLLRKKSPKLDKVEAELTRAVSLFPEFSAAWHLLGKVKANREDWEGAREAFQKAVEYDPKFLPPHLALGQLEQNLQQWEAAAAAFDRALELNPFEVQARFSSGLSHYYLGNLEIAREAFQAVMGSERAAQYPGIHYALGLVLARQGRVPEAAAELRLHLEKFPEGEVAEQIQLQLAEWRRRGLIEP